MTSWTYSFSNVFQVGEQRAVHFDRWLFLVLTGDVELHGGRAFSDQRLHARQGRARVAP